MEAVAAASLATIIGAPILSDYGFRFGFIENIVSRIVLVGIIIYVTQQDTFLGLITFLAVFTLLLERNHALALDLPNQRNNSVINSHHSEPSKAAAPKDTTSHTVSKDEYDNHDISDNIPRLSPAPGSSGATAFFRQLGL
jgi:hypothetical protein